MDIISIKRVVYISTPPHKDNNFKPTKYNSPPVIILALLPRGSTLCRGAIEDF